MNDMESKNFGHADEVRTLPKTKIEVVNLGDTTLMRTVFEPGWKWSQCVKPTVGTNSCETTHTLYVISGKLAIVMDDGHQKELGKGDVAIIPAGHDAWVIGEEPCVAIDFSGGKSYGIHP